MDPFTAWLKENGYSPKCYQPMGFLGGPQVGWSLDVNRSEFVYRIAPEAPEALIIVLFKRKNDRLGLRSPFADIVRLISLVKRSGLPLKTIQGRVEALEDRPEDSLENERIAAFYQRYLAAYEIFMREGVQWFEGKLATYESPLRVDRKRLAKEMGNG